MTNEEFKYWINGYLSLSSEEEINNHQMKIIINHANLVKSISGKLDQSIVKLISLCEEKIRDSSSLGIVSLKATGFK